jgi:hypothetical protein
MVTEEISPSLLKFAPYNPREITDHDFEALKKSIKEFGFVEPVVVNKKDNQIIGGHMRVRAAMELGFKTVPVAWVDLDEKRAKILNLSLNRISGRWDIPKLEEMIYELAKTPDIDLTLSGFEDWELKLYNPGEESSLDELENIQGTDPNGTWSILVTFSSKAKYEECSMFLSGGKIVKEIDGENLWEIIKK